MTPVLVIFLIDVSDKSNLREEELIPTDSLRAPYHDVRGVVAGVALAVVTGTG